jgi:hypothetical protein
LILYLQNQSIHISAETLLTFLERAEATARRRIPPEHLDPDREGIFAKQEQRAVKETMMDDVSYKASSSEAKLE